MKSDIEIARETDLRKIKEVATTLGIPREEVQNYGRYIAKVPIHLIDKKQMDQHNLILVTAITPTKAGIGKTTVSIGLALVLPEVDMPKCFLWKTSTCILQGIFMRLLPPTI